jgi:hypothetical protein
MTLPKIPIVVWALLSLTVLAVCLTALELVRPAAAATFGPMVALCVPLLLNIIRTEGHAGAIQELQERVGTSAAPLPPPPARRLPNDDGGAP